MHRWRCEQHKREKEKELETRDRGGQPVGMKGERESEIGNTSEREYETKNERYARTKQRKKSIKWRRKMNEEEGWHMSETKA